LFEVKLLILPALCIAMREHILKARDNWGEAWANKAFRKRFLNGVFVGLLVFAYLPFYFNYIEHRNGVLLNDWVLNWIPALDVSWALILLLWGGFFYFFLRSFEEPETILMFVYTTGLVTVFRIMAIYLVPLDPPIHLIQLHDQLSDILYFGGFKTKDLFFSGHESYIFVLALCITNKSDKRIMFVGSFLLGVLLLVQHIHYTIDVLGAPVFAYLAYSIIKKTGVTEF
jgi:magnesium-transporting ATPase (P-type)